MYLVFPSHHLPTFSANLVVKFCFFIGDSYHWQSKGLLVRTLRGKCKGSTHFCNESEIWSFLQWKPHYQTTPQLKGYYFYMLFVLPWIKSNFPLPVNYAFVFVFQFTCQMHLVPGECFNCVNVLTQFLPQWCNISEMLSFTQQRYFTLSLFSWLVIYISVLMFDFLRPIFLNFLDLTCCSEDFSWHNVNWFL